jgi:hypothetical protein
LVVLPSIEAFVPVAYRRWIAFVYVGVVELRQVGVPFGDNAPVYPHRSRTLEPWQRISLPMGMDAVRRDRARKFIIRGAFQRGANYLAEKERFINQKIASVNQEIASAFD